MCGIAGEYRFDAAAMDPRVLARMMDAQRHRGPDDKGMQRFSLRSGAASFEGGIGFNRLSILDLSPNGHQPMTNEDGSVIIAFNGEIYNARDHRPGLETAGYRFRSTTDTEVILRLYERHGLVGMLERLNGMFALCIVDLRRRELLLARDRLGIKPLYWCDLGGTLLFASEAKSFLFHPEFHPALEPGRMTEFLMFRTGAGEATLLRGVRSLEPGSWMRIRPEGIERGTYWTIPERGGDGVSAAAALDETEERIQASVRRQLWSDVKLGCQLSGGVDSSLVTLFAARAAGAGLDAFSVVFREAAFDEGPWIDRAAARAGVHVHRHLLDGDTFQRTLDAATWHMDAPMAHPNAVGIYRLAENARKSVTVLLSGEGADELFGGYTRFLKASIRPKIAAWLPLLGRLPGGLGRRVKKTFGEGSDTVGWFLLQSAFLEPSHLMELLPDADPASALAGRREIFAEGRGDFLANCMRYELRTYLADLLLRQDKMTMAHAVENRVPYLDHELVAYVRGLPSRYLVGPAGGGMRPKTRGTKVLLKRVALRHFESDFVFRPKQGFAIPVRSYFTASPMREWMEDAVLPGILSRGVVRGDVVHRWWRDLVEGREAPVDGIWIAVAFELWARRFLDFRACAPSREGERRTA